MEDRGAKYNPIVTELVRALNWVGIPTVGSSDGDVDRVPYPYVDIEVEACEQGALDYLGLALDKIKQEVPALPDKWVLDPSCQMSSGDHFVEARRLCPFGRNTEKSIPVLEAQQQGAVVLTKALKEHFGVPD